MPPYYDKQLKAFYNKQKYYNKKNGILKEIIPIIILNEKVCIIFD
jgi:hypothetical protein